jgi:hypothetical protein
VKKFDILNQTEHFLLLKRNELKNPPMKIRTKYW